MFAIIVMLKNKAIAKQMLSRSKIRWYFPAFMIEFDKMLKTAPDHDGASTMFYIWLLLSCNFFPPNFFFKDTLHTVVCLDVPSSQLIVLCWHKNHLLWLPNSIVWHFLKIPSNMLPITKKLNIYKLTTTLAIRHNTDLSLGLDIH